MSNDAKFWAIRVGIAVCILVDLYLLGQIQVSALSGQSPAPWFVGLMVSLAVSIPLFIAHTYYKSRRWTNDDSNQKTSVEILASAGKKAQQEHDKDKDSNPSR